MVIGDDEYACWLLNMGEGDLFLCFADADLLNTLAVHLVRTFLRAKQLDLFRWTWVAMGHRRVARCLKASAASMAGLGSVLGR